MIWRWPVAVTGRQGLLSMWRPRGTSGVCISCPGSNRTMATDTLSPSRQWPSSPKPILGKDFITFLELRGRKLAPGTEAKWLQILEKATAGAGVEGTMENSTDSVSSSQDASTSPATMLPIEFQKGSEASTASSLSFSLSSTLKGAGLPPRDRRYILWSIEKLRQGLPAKQACLRSPRKEHRKARGHGPKVQGEYRRVEGKFRKIVKARRSTD